MLDSFLCGVGCNLYAAYYATIDLVNNYSNYRIDPTIGINYDENGNPEVSIIRYEHQLVSNKCKFAEIDIEETDDTFSLGFGGIVTKANYLNLLSGYGVKATKERGRFGGIYWSVFSVYAALISVFTYFFPYVTTAIVLYIAALFVFTTIYSGETVLLSRRYRITLKAYNLRGATVSDKSVIMSDIKTYTFVIYPNRDVVLGNSHRAQVIMQEAIHRFPDINSGHLLQIVSVDEERI